MSARELAEPCPPVSTDDGAADAARLSAGHKLPALLVVAPDGQPYPVVSGEIAGLTVADRLPHRRFRPTAVGPDTPASCIWRP
jgi:hypothetical protein